MDTSTDHGVGRAASAGAGDSQQDLPYDPEEWERRLAEARERRAQVLAARLADARTTGAAARGTTQHDTALAIDRPDAQPAEAPRADALATRADRPADKKRRADGRAGASARPVRSVVAARSRLSAKDPAPALGGLARSFAFGIGVGLPVALVLLAIDRGAPRPPAGGETAMSVEASSGAQGATVAMVDTSVSFSAVEAVPGGTGAAPPADYRSAATATPAAGADPAPAPGPASAGNANPPSDPAALPAGGSPSDTTPAEALASDMSPTAIGGRAEAPDPAPAVPGDDPAGPDAAAPESPDPPPALDLPATARVMIHVPVRPSAAGRQAIEAMAEAGIALPETRGVPFTIAMSQVRFYHAADEAAARVLAEAADLALRDFTDYRPLPDTGLIEVWIAGSAPDRQDTTASRFDPDRAANGVARALRDLFRNFPAHEGR